MIQNTRPYLCIALKCFKKVIIAFCFIFNQRDRYFNQNIILDK